MIDDFHNELRQPLQVIVSEAGNIRDRLLELGIRDADLTESSAAIERAIVRIDQMLLAENAKGQH